MGAQDERLAPDSEFKPNLVNTVCFLVNWVIQITTFAVNYVGHPFNTALADNRGLYFCIRCPRPHLLFRHRLQGAVREPHD